MKREEFLRSVERVEKIIGYSFRNKALLAQAFTRTSYCNENRLRGKPAFESNEVLEFFGDGVLSLGIITALMLDKTRNYEFGISTELGEGDFSNIKSKLSDKKNLSASTFALGLEKYLIMGEGDEKLGIANEPSVAEDLFESIIGAVYIDTGLDMQVVMRVIEKMLDTSVYTKNDAPRGSAKGALQEFCADKRRRLPAPQYKTVSESGPDHKKVYERAVYLGGELIATGKGKNLKLADAECAEAALRTLTEREKNATRVACKGEDKTLAKKKKGKKEGTPKDAAPGHKQKKNAIDPTGSAQKLRELSAREKKAAPLYRDLGESANGEYRVECTYTGIKSIGTGRDRREAREFSSLEVLNLVKRKKK